MTIEDIRSFNRFYTNLIGALDYSRQLHTPYTLTEARVLYELSAARQADAADLRGALTLDAGYLSRLLGKFEKDGLITRGPSAVDARRQRVALTPRGREAAHLLEERSREQVGTLLARVPADRRARLAAAMSTVRELLAESAMPHTAVPNAVGEAELREPGPGELGWIVKRHGEVYAQEYGWNAEFEALVARIVADHAARRDPACERTWIADLGGRPVGTVMCVRDEAPDTARLRLLLVDPEVRGHRLGARLVDTCVSFAREAGYRELVLWTNSVLESARRLYERAGFELTAEKPHHSYGADLVGQDWRLTL
ncbi:helix-turn-helix domain-containing GNAT family N-acetyltransferase [Streptomyces sp. WMMC500]|uniref:bifunctional helix-turn-helix transcriptional regulator/GNAT family N-acetyltransferase n=1 Tax=Streptomyces sp. WMMC500 TaxID=3015154 RepID=UPI00248BFEF6|nr:helix-turn-helix domain-containing GNAT family N-acetyltransferase [Streptomyces sp. WMMC500]WBB59211.1 helix-turn-helix domain-containing GNAT family N-acetyltransferase [Streptomyces sp. WMMC500]